LTIINNEAKVRRSTKALVLGTAKVMRYKELEEARAKRAERDTIQEAKGKGKRGRKRKSAILEAEAEAEVEEPEPEPNTKMVRTSKAPVPSRASVI
jgi:hypothetical protein